MEIKGYKKYNTFEYAIKLCISTQAVIKKIHNENIKNELLKKSSTDKLAFKKKYFKKCYFPIGSIIEKNRREWIIYIPLI